jgi:magnesium transporter
MINRFNHQGIDWVDLENPTSEEVETIAQEFNLGPVLAQDLLAPSIKPRVDLYPNILYAVLHFPAVRHTGGASQNYEVDFVIGNTFLITAHYDVVPALYEFTRSFEADALLKHPGKSGYASGQILLELAEHLYNSVEHELESLEDSINAIEHQIFSGNEKEMVIAISLATRELLNQKRSLAAHAGVLESLEQTSVMTFGESYGNYLRGVKLFHGRVYNHALALTDTLTELRETNTALLSTRQNEVMKSLTIMTFATAPLALTVSIFGISSPFIPLVNSPDGFWIILGMLAFLATCLLIYFKIKRWL